MNTVKLTSLPMPLPMQQFHGIQPYLKDFAQVGWCVSIDGTAQEYEYLEHQLNGPGLTKL